MGLKKCDSTEESLLRVEKCSPWGSPRKLGGEAGEEPEEHKRIGILMGQEICLVLGQDSLNFLYWKKNLQKDICGPGRD